MTHPLELPGWRHVFAGKVRDIYIPQSAEQIDDATQILMVASDRVSAFDYMLEPPIPHKGEVLTSLTVWWLRHIDQPNHLLSTDVPDAVAGRAVICRRLQMHPIECVVRGYLAGSAWSEYQQSGAVCGVALPAGLAFGDKLVEPIFTPAWKAPQGEHDENITFERTAEIVGPETAEALRDTSLSIYRQGAAIAESRGLIVADTKFEFGDDLGRLVLADEVLTPDSSRYWDGAQWEAGDRDQSWDKQIVRNWLAEHWDRTGEPPALPADIIMETSRRYRELATRIEGAEASA